MNKDEALRLALEALESTGENNGYHGVTQYFDETMVDQAITAIKASLEAKDEAWEKFCDSHCVWTDHHPDCKLAQRTWVGLTDAEVDQAFTELTLRKIYQAIEAKLKEKNFD